MLIKLNGIFRVIIRWIYFCRKEEKWVKIVGLEVKEWIGLEFGLKVIIWYIFVFVMMVFYDVLIKYVEDRVK